MLKSPPKQCLGFPAGTPCARIPGTPWSPFWCGPCDEQRRAYLGSQLKLVKSRHALASDAVPQPGEFELCVACDGTEGRIDSNTGQWSDCASCEGCGGSLRKVPSESRVPSNLRSLNKRLGSYKDRR